MNSARRLAADVERYSRVAAAAYGSTLQARERMLGTKDDNVLLGIADVEEWERKFLNR